MKKNISLLVIPVLLLVFISCENNNPSSSYHKVIFDSNGGQGTVSEKYVKDGECVEEPKSPTKSDAVFSSWTLDGSAYNFSTPLTSDITLKAVYTPLYTITFDSDGGTYTPEAQYIKENEKVIEPKSPDKSSTRGFMWWVTENNEPYDFSKEVTSSFTLKAVYWPANFTNAEKDSSKYDKQVQSQIINEADCLYHIVSNFVSDSLKKMMSGEKDIATIFNVEDNKSAGDVIRTIVANAKMDGDYITIKGEKVNLSNTGTTIHLGDAKYRTIGNNNSRIEDFGSSGIVRTKYSIDISNLAFSTNFYKSDGSGINETIETTLSVKGIVMKYDTHMEFHIEFTIDGIEYPVLHAKTFNTTGDSEEMTLNYRGYTGFFYTHDN